MPGTRMVGDAKGAVFFGGRGAERSLVSDEFLCGLGFELLCLFGIFYGVFAGFG